MRRIRIKLAYDGGGFHGWQIQPELPTIQGTLERILSEIEGKPVQVAAHYPEQCPLCALGIPVVKPGSRPT